jgi:hypothetical protein
VKPIEVVRYEPHLRQEWDDAVLASRSRVFLFLRDYMDYHSDRFRDHSLIFKAAGRIVAVLPASERGDQLSSHAGLTFGGLLLAPRTTTSITLDVMDALQEHLREGEFTSLLYKAVPHIYQDHPAEEDLYALFRAGARLVRRDVSSAIRLGARLPLSKGRKSAVTVARKAGVVVERSHDFAAFMAVEDEQLQARFDTAAVHSGAEMTSLAARFPDNIALYTAALDGELIAGTIVYESRQVAHTQYIAATDVGRSVSAMDLVLSRLLTEDYAHKRWFDFGISTSEEGRRLNTGLIANKESYGARAVAHDFYALPPASEGTA